MGGFFFCAMTFFVFTKKLKIKRIITLQQKKEEVGKNPAKSYHEKTHSFL